MKKPEVRGRQCYPDPDAPVPNFWDKFVDPSLTPEENYARIYYGAFDEGDKYGMTHPHPGESMGR